jgi:hypothetical protein
MQFPTPIALPAGMRRMLADEYASLTHSDDASQEGFAQLLAYANSTVNANLTPSGKLALRDRLVELRVVSDAPPYHAFSELKSDALVNGVASFDNEPIPSHPFWTGDDMVTYMHWHDLLGHVETNLDFSSEGELALFTHHATELLDHDQVAAVNALFVEVVYRVSWVNEYGWTFTYKPVTPGPLAQHVMRQVLTGQPVTMPVPAYALHNHRHLHYQPMV